MVWPSPDTTVYNEPINVFAAKNDNWTLSLDYARNTSFGAFEVTGAETIEEHNQQEATPGAPFLEYVGFPNSGGVAKTKATGTLRWSLRSLRWPPKTGQVGSLSPNQKYDPENVHETTPA